METNKIQMTVTVDPKVKKALEKAAEKEGRTVSNYVNTSLKTILGVSGK